MEFLGILAELVIVVCVIAAIIYSVLTAIAALEGTLEEHHERMKGDDFWEDTKLILCGLSGFCAVLMEYLSPGIWHSFAAVFLLCFFVVIGFVERFANHHRKAHHTINRSNGEFSCVVGVSAIVLTFVVIIALIYVGILKDEFVWFTHTQHYPW